MFWCISFQTPAGSARSTSFIEPKLQNPDLMFVCFDRITGRLL
jgi:hypothetical protein